MKLRSAAIAANWDEKKRWLNVFELLAVALIKLIEQKAIDDDEQLEDERLVVEPYEGESAGDYFGS